MKHNLLVYIIFGGASVIWTIFNIYYWNVVRSAKREAINLEIRNQQEIELAAKKLKEELDAKVWIL